jgi:predicted secreted Zn-dependent protease
MRGMTALATSPAGGPACPAAVWPLVLACLLILTGCTSGKPGTTNRSYSIHAETRTGFAQSVRSRAPRGGRAFGLVEITFHPDYKLVAGSSGCRADVRSVELELVITLPKWRDGKPVPGSVGPHWKRFERTVRQHEMTHVRIAKDYAARMRGAIAALRSATCKELAGRIKTRIKSIKVQHLRAQERFDRREQRRLKALLPG